MSKHAVLGTPLEPPFPGRDRGRLLRPRLLLERRTALLGDRADIGGVRAVLQDQSTAYKVANRLRKNWTITKFRGKVEVEQFGTDYDAAQAASTVAEQENGIETKLDVVLLSADSLDTIKQTHSSYFSGKAQLKELLQS